MLGISAKREDTKRSFLEESAWLRFSSPLFSALSGACAEDPDLIELGTSARAGQSAGMLLPMAAQYSLLKSSEPRLAHYFPSMTDIPGSPQQAFPAFREFCLDRREEIAQLLAQRTVNTNLVERSSSILAALAHVSRLTGQPLTLVEICCSVGLNLLFDRYHYDYGPAGRVGLPDSPVQLGCKIIGGVNPRVDAIPEVARRIGVDLVKIDPTEPAERLWMSATLFPEWKAEREHLEAALALLASHPVEIIEGNALQVLPPLLEELSGPVCVLHTHCMGQWTEAAKAALDDILRRASRDRDIHRIGIDRIHQEPPEAVRTRLGKLAAAKIPLMQKSLPSQIEHIWYSRSRPEAHSLGQADGCGAWIDWRVSA